MRFQDEDLESEAIARCTKALYPLDDPTKFRVIKYLLDRFNLFVHVTPEPVKSPEIINQNINYQQNNLLLVESGKPNMSIAKSGAYPTLKDVVIKNLTKTERELLLIMVFYASDYGRGTFLRSQITELYREHGIHSEGRIKNSTGNINGLIKRSLIKSINGEEMGITPEGIQIAEDTLNGNLSQPTRPRLIKSSKKKQKPKQNKNEEDESDE